MGYYDGCCPDEFYGQSEYDEIVEDFKETLKESVKTEWVNEMNRIRSKNTDLQSKVKQLENEKEELKEKLVNTNVNNDIVKILKGRIDKENVFKIIKEIFSPTFTEKGNECPEYWLTYINYYNDRNDVIELLKYAGVDIPENLTEVILPHEWGKNFLDIFFNTINNHYVCNGCIYENNLRYWGVKSAQSISNLYSNYSDTPWQFVLRNPLLNSQEYAKKMADKINKNHNGIYFCEIDKYQILDDGVLSILINNIEPDNKNKKSIKNDLLFRHIDYVLEKNKLDTLFEILQEAYNPYSTVLKMPKEYQIKYASSMKDVNRAIEFLNRTELKKKDKESILAEYI